MMRFPEALLRGRSVPLKNNVRHTRNNLSNSPIPHLSLWDERLKSWMKRFEDVFGITKLTELHNKVLQVQSNVEEAQTKRRKVQNDIMTVQNSLQDIQAKLEKINRGDDMFLSIVTQEHELLKEQRRLQNLLTQFDRTERDEQSALARAIYVSQDHERTYREKNKYLSLITGVIGSLIGVLCSSINNWRHKRDIRSFADRVSHLINEQKTPNSETSNLGNQNLLQDISQNIIQLKTLFSPNEDMSGIIKKLENQTNSLISLVEAQELALTNATQNIHSFMQNGEGGNETSDELTVNTIMKKILEEIDHKVEKQSKSYAYKNVIFVSTALLLTATLMNIMSR